MLALVAVVDLALSVRARAHWHAPAGSQQSLTLPQLLGFVSTVALLLGVGLILFTGWRNWRTERRYHALAARLSAPGSPETPGPTPDDR